MSFSVTPNSCIARIDSGVVLCPSPGSEITHTPPGRIEEYDRVELRIEIQLFVILGAERDACNGFTPLDLVGAVDHLRCNIASDDIVAALREHPTRPASTTPEVQQPRGWRRQQLHDLPESNQVPSTLRIGEGLPHRVRATLHSKGLEIIDLSLLQRP
jgi:hypothetical protein